MRFWWWSLLLALATACASLPKENTDWAWDTTWPPTNEYERMGHLLIDFEGRKPPRTVLLISHGLQHASENSLAVAGAVGSFPILPGEYVVVWDDEKAGDFLKLRARVPQGGVARLNASDGVPDDEAPFPWKGGKLSVMVRDMRGRPLPGVRVMVRGWGIWGSTKGFGDDTDERGLLEATVRAGEIHVLLGYHRRIVTVREDRETRVVFRYRTEGAIRIEPRPSRPVIRPKGARKWLLRHGMIHGEDHVTWVHVPPGEYEVGDWYGDRPLGEVRVRPGKTTVVRLPGADLQRGTDSGRHP